MPAPLPNPDTPLPLPLPFENATGRGIRIAVIDSGVNPRHPHIGPVAGGIAIGKETGDAATQPEGRESYIDVLGHGTAVMAAIQEKAPEAEYFAVRIFHSALRTKATHLIRAIEWAIENRMNIVNLSLGTLNPAHTDRFTEVAIRAEKAGVLMVAARDVEGTPCLPGSLASVVGTGLDWECDRNRYRCEATTEGFTFYTSGYPRPAPGVPPRRNLNGISFAVANMSGFAARAAEAVGSARNPDRIKAALMAEAANYRTRVNT